MADDGRLLLCFFAPGCEHCRATIKSIDSLSRINSDFPKVEIVFMEEEVEKIPDFFDYAGNEFSYIVLDISTFMMFLHGKEILLVCFTCGMVILLKNLME